MELNTLESRLKSKSIEGRVGYIIAVVVILVSAVITGVLLGNIFPSVARIESILEICQLGQHATKGYCDLLD